MAQVVHTSTNTVMMDTNVRRNYIRTTTYVGRETSLHLPPVFPEQKQNIRKKYQLPNIVLKKDQLWLKNKIFCTDDNTQTNQIFLERTKPESKTEHKYNAQINQSSACVIQPKLSSADLVKKGDFERKSKAFEVVHSSTRNLRDDVKIFIPDKIITSTKVLSDITTQEKPSSDIKTQEKPSSDIATQEKPSSNIITQEKLSSDITTREKLIHKIELKNCASTKRNTMSNQDTLDKFGERYKKQKERYKREMRMRVKASPEKNVTPVENKLAHITKSGDDNRQQHPDNSDDTILLIWLILSLEAEYPTTFFEGLCSSQSFVAVVKNRLSKDSLKLLTHLC